MASGDTRRSSEDMLRQRDFMLIAVVVCHLNVPSICQLRSSTISSAFSCSVFRFSRSAHRPFSPKQLPAQSRL
jgi:hypothetical protein